LGFNATIYLFEKLTVMRISVSIFLFYCLFVSRVTAQSTASFIAVSDIHLDTSNTPTWEAAAKTMTQIAQGKNGGSKPSFILYLGDLPVHSDPHSTAQVANAMNEAGIALKGLRGIAEQANIPLLYLPGNNDSYTGDYHVFDTTIFKKDTMGANRWPVIPGNQPISHQQDPYIGDQSLSRLGCYTAFPLGKSVPLEVIALNTVMFSQQRTDSVGMAYNYCNGHPEKRQQDAEQEITWLWQQLEAAAGKGQQVLIAMHIPPGRDGYTGANSLTTGGKLLWDSTLLFRGMKAQFFFVSLITAFKNNIIGLIGGHTHLDGIRIVLDSTNAPILPYISVPAISADHGNNSCFKVVEYDASQKYALTNFVTYYHRKTDPVIQFDSTYSFNQTFENTGGLSILGRLQQVFNEDKSSGKSRLSIYLDRIYSTNNGPSYLISNDSQVTLYIRRLDRY
jgi:sphingomyelin phosphodiesterase acid-like 3